MGAFFKMDNEVLIKDDIVIGRAGERDLKADLFLPPESTSNSKAIVIVHGGGWREGSKEQLRGYGILLSREGFVCLCAEYRLSQEEKWPAQMHWPNVDCLESVILNHEVNHESFCR